MKQDLIGSVIVLATLCLLLYIRNFILSFGKRPHQPRSLKAVEPKDERSDGDTHFGVSRDRPKPVGHIEPLDRKYARQVRHKE